jgi:hypothetical protein
MSFGNANISGCPTVWGHHALKKDKMPTSINDSDAHRATQRLSTLFASLQDSTRQID